MKPIDTLNLPILNDFNIKEDNETLTIKKIESFNNYPEEINNNLLEKIYKKINLIFPENISNNLLNNNIEIITSNIEQKDIINENKSFKQQFLNSLECISTLEKPINPTLLLPENNNNNNIEIEIFNNDIINNLINQINPKHQFQNNLLKQIENYNLEIKKIQQEINNLNLNDNFDFKEKELNIIKLKNIYEDLLKENIEIEKDLIIKTNILRIKINQQ